MELEHTFQVMAVRQLRMSGFIVVNCDIMDSLRFLHGIKNRAYYVNTHKMRGYTNGQPDIIAGKNGTFYAIEFKTKTGRVSPAQKEFKKFCDREGLPYLIIKDFNDVTKLINANFRGVSVGGTE